MERDASLRNILPVGSAYDAPFRFGGTIEKVTTELR